MGFIQKLQNKWQVSFYQVIIILIVFALTGTTILFLKEPILGLIVGKGEINWVHRIAYFVLILPVYNLFLLIYGALFGQFKFFWEYEKKFFRRIFGKKKKREVRIQKEV